jgi:hypothetical protein
VPIAFAAIQVEIEAVSTPQILIVFVPDQHRFRDFTAAVFATQHANHIPFRHRPALALDDLLF